MGTRVVLTLSALGVSAVTVAALCATAAAAPTGPGDLLATPSSATPGTQLKIHGFNHCPIPNGATSRPKDVVVVMNVGFIDKGTFNFIQGWQVRVNPTSGKWSTTYIAPTFGSVQGEVYGRGGDLVGQTIDYRPGTYYFSASCTTNIAVSADSYYSYALAPFKLMASLGNGVTNGSPNPASRAAPIASTLGTPGEIFGSASHDLVDATITLAIVLFIAFPATIFNQTFAENYDVVILVANRWRRKVRRLVTGWRTNDPIRGSLESAADTKIVNAEPSTPGRTTSIWFCGTLLAGSVFAGLLNPTFGSNWSSLELLLGTVLAFFVGATVTWLVTRFFRRMHGYTTSTYPRALPVGLAIGAVCVLISRSTHFEPGYLYGIVVSFAFAGSLNDRHNAHLVAISSLSTLIVGFASWLLWIPINHQALHHGVNPLTIIVDDALATVFVGSLVGTVFLLMPLKGLPGGDLAKWRRDAWAFVFFVAMFLLVAVELRPAGGPTHPGSAPAVTAVVLFVLFGGLSLGTRRYFKAKAAASRGARFGAASPVGANQEGDQ